MGTSEMGIKFLIDLAEERTGARLVICVMRGVAGCVIANLGTVIDPKSAFLSSSLLGSLDGRAVRGMSLFLELLCRLNCL